MTGILKVLGALGAGAALMYVLDPEQGNRRRASIRDKGTKLNRQTREAVSGKMKDLSNRAKGLLHDARGGVSSQTETGTEAGNFTN